MKIFVISLEDTRLSHRIDLLDWLCSPEVKKGQRTDTHWVVDTSVRIYNQYMDIDVGYLTAMLERVSSAGYKSLMIMRYGTDYRGTNSSSNSSKGDTRQSEIQQADSPPSGEVPDGESNTEILAGSSHPTDNSDRQSES